MSLHCPARLVVMPPGTTAELSDRRIAAVYAGPGEATAAQAPATGLALPVTVVPALERGLDAAVQEIGDLHPGETVLVVTGCVAPMEIEYDGDTWAVVHRP